MNKDDFYKDRYYYKGFILRMLENEDGHYYAALILAVLCANLLICAFTGMWPWRGNAYNSYALQAEAWLNGSLDLGRDYTHLELAVYNGKYYVSFPPLPSIILLPFAAFMGSNTPDQFLVWAAACLAAVYAYKLARLYIGDKTKAALYSLFLCVGTNFLFVSNTGGVWFMAQAFAFSITLMSLYYACLEKPKPAAALFLLCCAMGCRPLNAVYLPIILYLIYKRGRGAGFASFVKTLAVNAIPAIVLGCVFMSLNYARFGNVFEFGHNYLPEFTESVNGQFSLLYIAENFKTLWRLPEIVDGALSFQKFDGTAFWLVSPIILVYAATFIRALNAAFHRKSMCESAFLLLPVFMLAHLLLLCAHKTMGGWHFGHRYTVDILPVLFLGFARQERGGSKIAMTLSVPLFIWGLCVNAVGTIFLWRGYL